MKPVLPVALGTLSLLNASLIQAGEAMPEIRVEATALDTLNAQDLNAEDSDTGLPSDTGEWLRSVLGVSGRRLGGHGIDPVIRGQGETRINVLIDGAYVHGGCPNRMDPPTSYAPLHSFDRITLYKGSQTVRYGGGGSGGTLLLERVTPAFTEGEAPRAEVSAGYAGNGVRHELFGDFAAGNTGGFLRLLAGRSEADNYKDGDGNEVRTAYEETGANVIAGLTPDADTRVELSLEATRADDVLFAGNMDAPVSDHDIARIQYSRSNLGGFLHAARAELYYSDVHHVMDNYSLRTLTAPMMMEVPSDSVTRGGRLTLDRITAGGALWTYGIDLQHNDREAVRYAGPTLSMVNSLLWPDVRLKQTGLFAETSMDLSPVRRLSAGIRYDRIEADARRAAEDIPDTMTTTLFSPDELYTAYYGIRARKTTENNVGGFIKLEQDVAAAHPLTAYASLSRSVRTADATERFMAANGMPALRWVGNPDIDPEQHHQLEAGVQARPAGWVADASVYIDSVRDYILRDTARGQDGILRADGATIYRNVDARLWGAEFQVRRQWSEHWSSDFGLAYVRGRNTDDSQDLAQIPALEFRLSLEYGMDRWGLGTRVRGADRQTNVDDDPATGSGLDTGQTPGYAVLDVYGHWQAAETVQLRWGVDNLLDKTYAEHLNRSNDFDPVQVQINEPGRSAWLKVRAAF